MGAICLTAELGCLCGAVLGSFVGHEIADEMLDAGFESRGGISFETADCVECGSVVEGMAFGGLGGGIAGDVLQDRYYNRPKSGL